MCIVNVWGKVGVRHSYVVYKERTARQSRAVRGRQLLLSERARFVNAVVALRYTIPEESAEIDEFELEPINDQDLACTKTRISRSEEFLTIDCIVTSQLSECLEKAFMVTFLMESIAELDLEDMVTIGARKPLQVGIDGTIYCELHA